MRAKKDYTPFPPPQQPSKVDLQMESGEYFLSKEIKEARAAAERRERQAAKVQARKAEREAAFAVPEVRVPACCCYYVQASVRGQSWGGPCAGETLGSSGRGGCQWRA